MSTHVSPYLHATLKPGVIYFARSQKTGLVKVRYSRHLDHRLKTIKEKDGALHLELVSLEEGERLAREEGGLPA